MKLPYSFFFLPLGFRLVVASLEGLSKSDDGVVFRLPGDTTEREDFLLDFLREEDFFVNSLGGGHPVAALFRRGDFFGDFFRGAFFGDFFRGAFFGDFLTPCLSRLPVGSTWQTSALTPIKQKNLIQSICL